MSALDLRTRIVLGAIVLATVLYLAYTNLIAKPSDTSPPAPTPQTQQQAASDAEQPPQTDPAAPDPDPAQAPQHEAPEAPAQTQPDPAQNDAPRDDPPAESAPVKKGPRWPGAQHPGDVRDPFSSR